MVAMTVAPLTCRYPKEISCFMCLFSTSWSESWSVYIYIITCFLMIDCSLCWINLVNSSIITTTWLFRSSVYRVYNLFFYIFWRWTWMFMVVSMFDTFYLMKPLLDSRHVEWKNRQRFWTQAKATKWWIQLIKHACGEESRCWFMLISLI